MTPHLIIFDFNRTLYNPEEKRVYADALNTLQTLYDQGHHLALISKRETGRTDLIDRLGIAQLFKKILLTEGKKIEDFNNVIESYPAYQVFVIGDRIKDEITLGNKCGATTIWFKNGKFADEDPKTKIEQPHHSITTLKEILTIIP